MLIKSLFPLALFPLALVATAVFAPDAANAHRVDPIRYELAPSGSAAQTTVLVTNTRSFPITIEAIPNTLSIAEDGSETLSPAEDDFLIFPPQAVIEPGKSQSFRVRYIGTPSLERSVAYRIGINQLPVDMREEGASGIGVTLNFATLANIIPAGATAAISVESIAPAPDGKWQLTLANTGTRFARLSEAQVSFTQGDRTEEFSGTRTQGWFDNNILLPGNRLNVTIPAPEGFDPGSTSVRIAASQ
ncbi:MAG: fimbria/pilus periplasmic chaperone [Pontixanthobacter sp.]